MPLTIDVTQANLPASTQLYAYIIGGVVTAPTPAPTPIENYWMDASGTLHVMQLSDNTQPAGSFPGMSSASAQINYQSNWADYSIPLSPTKPTMIDLANINNTQIPSLGVGTNAFSGRIYISAGPKLPFTVLTPPATTSPNYTGPNPYAGPSFNTGAPGSLCLFDWFEFSLDINGILNGNSTYVNSFALPLSITVTPGSATPQGALSITRHAVMQAIAQFPAPLDAGVLLQAVPAADAALYPAAYLRAISPDTLSADSGGSSQFQTYFDSTIQKAYSAWASTPIVVTGVATKSVSSGMVVNNELIFISGTYTDSATWNAQYAQTTASEQMNFGLITTAMIWQCIGSLATGSAVQLSIGKQLAAAFNRGVVVNSLNQVITSLNDGACPTVDPTTQAPYYPANVASNYWAYQFHLWNLNHLAYGFGYDDICSQNPSFNTSSTLQSLNITLGTMK